MSKPAAPQGTLSPGITPHDLLHSGRPGLSKTMGGPSLRPGQLDKLGCHQRVPGGHLALRGGFEHAGRQPWQLHNQTAGSSGGEESCWAATTDPSPLRNSQPPVPKCARSSPSSLPLPHMAEKRLSKMLRSHSALNKNALRHYRGCVGFFLTGGGQCQGHVLLETVGGGGGGGRSSGFWSPAASACSSLPMSILQKRHTEMFRPFPREAGKAGESRLLRSAVGPFEYLRDHPRGTAPLRVFITSVLPAPRVIIHS